jgi:hypothetical protein
MTLPIREQVTAAIATALLALDGVTVFRNRSLAPDDADLPALILFDGDHKAPTMDQGTLITSYRLQLTIQGQVTAASDALLGPSATELYAVTLEAVLMDPTLAGLAVDVEEGDFEIKITAIEGSTPRAIFTLPLFVTYWTQAGQPRVAAP